MFPVTEIAVGRALGLVFVAISALLAWWNPTVLEAEEGSANLSGRHLALGFGLVGGVLLVIGQVAVLPWPTYGLMMGIGTVSSAFLAMQWCRRRGISGEVVLEFALIGFAAGLIGGRLVHVAENWDSRFAAQPATVLIGVDAPLGPGDALALRTPQGQAEVTFLGDERDAAAVAARFSEVATLGVQVEVVRALHRGDAGVLEHTRGLRITTQERGETATLELLGGAALPKLGLQAGVASGAPAAPLSVVLFDLSAGGLTFFGAVIGILIAWSGWIVYRKLPFWTILDAGAPIFPWGTAWGRLGCFAKGCCWGRETGGAGVEFPPWSLPWYQLAGERLSCRWDGALAEGEMTAGLSQALGPLAEGTPPLHATQLYEGLGALLIFAAVLLYQRRWQRNAGQSFALLILLQSPLRWIDEHFRRDHDYFFQWIPGYPLTVTQVTSGLFFVLGVGLMIWLSKRGEPIPEGGPTISPTGSA